MKLLYLLLGLVTLSTQIHAEDVSLIMPNGQAAPAVYLEGNAQLPSVLLLHGFLQTHNFHTIHQLTEGLNGEGYTVLAPTLSLNVPLRAKSLACEAIHTHRVEDAWGELDSWIEWLHEKHAQPVVVLGHSTGSMELVSYMAERPNPLVKQLIGVSIIEGRMQHDPERSGEVLAELREMLDSGEDSLVERTFSYCKPLRAKVSSLVSYLSWTPDRLLQAIDAIQVPQFYIMGGLDERLGEDWIERLKATGKPVKVIDGANHFIDGEYEFELLELVLDALA